MAVKFGKSSSAGTLGNDESPTSYSNTYKRKSKGDRYKGNVDSYTYSLSPTEYYNYDGYYDDQYYDWSKVGGYNYGESQYDYYYY